MADVEDCKYTKREKEKVICEVSYVPQIGQWTYFHLRPDKNRPNFISTVMSNLMDQAEAITIEELTKLFVPVDRNIGASIDQLFCRDIKSSDSVATSSKVDSAERVESSVTDSEWTRHFSNTHQKYYLYNSLTKETKWL